MNKNKKSVGILITAITAVLALIIIGGIMFYNRIKDTSATDNPGTIDLTGYPGTGDIMIRSASYIYSEDGKISGYLVSVSSKGYNGNIIMEITFDNTGNIVKSVVIKDQKEPKDYGDKITEDTFLSQFSGITAPISLSGTDTKAPDSVDSETEAQVPETETTDSESTDNEAAIENTANDTSHETAGTIWADGTYEAEESEFDQQGYKDKVTLTIEDGKMTEIIWDAYNKNGELKSVLSADGIYEMDGGGLTWQEQAYAITDFLVQNQSTNSITMDDNGKTDAVTGVSISVKDFILLVKDCLAKASKEPSTGTVEEPSLASPSVTPAVTPDITDTTNESTDTKEDNSSDNFNKVDGVSGATVSSAAVVDGINKAQAFLKDFVFKN